VRPSNEFELGCSDLSPIAIERANRMDTERWYVAVAVVASRVDGLPHDPLVDLQLRLIRATDDEQAYRRAIEVGSRLGHSYRNAEGTEVVWEFRGLRDLRQLDHEELSHGAEVYR
jgi:hypothetical protein